LNHNKINVILNNAFAGLDTLEILSVYENKISAVDPNAFHGLEKYKLIFKAFTSLSLFLPFLLLSPAFYSLLIVA